MTGYGLRFLDPKSGVTVQGDYALRWFAPELIDSPGTYPTAESKEVDVFAFGFVAAEVFAGEEFLIGRRGAAILHISEGARPKKPADFQAVGLTDEMWKLIEACWQLDPNERPTMENVVRQWEKLVWMVGAGPQPPLITEGAMRDFASLPEEGHDGQETSFFGSYC